MALLTDCRRAACLLGVLMLMAVPAAGQLPEADAKAAFLARLPLFVDWPTDALAAGQPLVIAVLGGHPLLVPLRKFSGQIVNGHAVEIRQITADDDLRRCHILFVPESAGVGAAALVDRLRGLPVLTVGEDPRFIAWGGMLRLRVLLSRLRFHVNLTRTDAGKLRISARLLALGLVERSADAGP